MRNVRVVTDFPTNLRVTSSTSSKPKLCCIRGWSFACVSRMIRPWRHTAALCETPKLESSQALMGLLRVTADTPARFAVSSPVSLHVFYSICEASDHQ